MAVKGLIARGVPTSLPRFYKYIIGAIIVLSIIILGLAAYAQSLSGSYFYSSGVAGFLIFVPIWTWLVYGGTLAIEHFAPQYYYRIAVLASQIVSAIFWLTGWAWAASWASYILSFDNYDPFDRVRGSWKSFGRTTAACAGIGALIWALTVIALVIFCWACMRSSESARNGNVELAHAKPTETTEQHHPTTSSDTACYVNQPVYGGESTEQQHPTTSSNGTGYGSPQPIYDGTGYGDQPIYNGEPSQPRSRI